MTARGWEDLSATMLLCEEEGIKVDETLVGQYLHNEKIVKEFTAYYELYNKYKKDYKVEEILNGTNSAQEVERARIAKFDERLSLLGMLLDKLESEMRENLETADYLTELMKVLKIIKVLHEKGGNGEKRRLAKLSHRRYRQDRSCLKICALLVRFPARTEGRTGQSFNSLRRVKKNCGSIGARIRLPC